MPDSKQILIDGDLHRRLKAHVANLGVSTMKSYVEMVLEHAMVTNGKPIEEHELQATLQQDPPQVEGPAQPPDEPIPPKDQEVDPDPEPVEPPPVEEPPVEEPPADPPKPPDSWGVSLSGTPRISGDDW